MRKYNGEKRALIRQVGRRAYSVSGRIKGVEKYQSIALARELGLEASEKVEQLLVEEEGVARLRRGDVILRRARVVETVPGDVR